jgi:hypothetical protein
MVTLSRLAAMSGWPQRALSAARVGGLGALHPFCVGETADMTWSPRLCALIAGVVVMVVASLWAPQQPELINTGGACQVAPCGTLEDSGRWQAAWWLWAAGFAVIVIVVPLLTPPARRLRPAQIVLGLVVAVIWVIATAVAAVIVALFTSVHGAATVAACGLVVPALALVTGLLRDSDGAEEEGRATPTRAFARGDSRAS